MSKRAAVTKGPGAPRDHYTMLHGVTAASQQSYPAIRHKAGYILASSKAANHNKSRKENRENNKGRVPRGSATALQRILTEPSNLLRNPLVCKERSVAASDDPRGAGAVTRPSSFGPREKLGSNLRDTFLVSSARRRTTVITAAGCRGTDIDVANERGAADDRMLVRFRRP